MTDERKLTVAAGYDAIARRYLDWSARVADDAREELLAELAGRLADGARILDLGCGAGGTARSLAERFRVVGVDISAAQVEIARTTVPGATFVVGDLAAIEFPERSFDAAIALYSISHVPREQHAAVFARISSWLVPGGSFLASLGATDAPDWTGDWLGVPMFFSAWDADTNRQLLREAGFELEIDEVRTLREPEGEVSFLWVLGRRAGGASDASATRRP